MFNRNIRMSTMDNKVKIQLRPSLPGSGPGIINRPDKNPSPSKLMINHGKPNYTINRSTTNLSPKNKSATTEIVTSPSLTFPLKSTINPLSPISSTTTSVAATSSTTTNQIEKIVLKHVHSTNNNVNSSNSGSTTINSKPSVVSPVNSFVSPGISSKAAATSFGVKLKQCNNKKNIQNGDKPTTNGRDQNRDDEPEFVRRQKQIFEKLQQREQQQQQQQQQIETTTIINKELNPNDLIISNDNNCQQNGYSKLNNLSEQTNGYHSQEKIIIDSHVKNVTNRLENVSSSTTTNNSINNCNEQQKNQQQQQNNSFKLPPGAICGKPAIPGKPANLQIPSGRYPQQSNLIKNQNNSIINTINSNNEIASTTTAAAAASTANATTTIEQATTTPNVNENSSVDNSISANFEQKTVVSFSKDLSTEPNRYPDTVKLTKTISNGNGFKSDVVDFNEEDDDDDGLKEFIAIEKMAESKLTSKLAEDMAQIKFDIKTDDEDVTITPVVIR